MAYEVLQNTLTAAFDFVLGGSALYFGGGFILYVVDRWNEIEVKPAEKSIAPALPEAIERPAVAIPISIKQPVPLEMSEPDAEEKAEGKKRLIE